MVPALFSFSGKSGTHGSVSARTVRKICTRGEKDGTCDSVTAERIEADI